MTIDFVGQGRTGRMLSSRDPVVLARAGKQLIQSGHWEQQIARDDQTKVLMSLKTRLPFAVGKLPTDALVALTKAPPPGGCAWCCCFIQRAPDKPELDRNEVTVALLGQGCARCQRRWQMDARVAELVEEAREEARLAAATPPPPEQDLPVPPASLPALVAAPTPAPARRVPDPDYYTPQPRPWPAEDTP
jgi:hypothetical protein